MKNDMVAASIRPQLRGYVAVAEGIARTIGDFCEVVLHDLSDVGTSIVAIFNRHVSGRTVGSPVTSYGLEILRKGHWHEPSVFCYKNTAEGRKKIKSSTVMIRDETGKLIGCLCINLDVTDLSDSCPELENLLVSGTEKAADERFAVSILDLETQLIGEAAERIGKPLSEMDEAERAMFLTYLDQKGLFLVKGAVQRVAIRLNISKYAVRGYLESSES